MLRKTAISLLAAGLLSLGAPALAQDYSVQKLAQYLETNSKKFEKQLDKELDAKVDGKAESQFEERAQELKAALDDVQGKIEGGNEKVTREKLAKALVIAHDVNEMMRQERFSPGLEADWAQLRGSLNALAAHYGMGPLQTFGRS